MPLKPQNNTRYFHIKMAYIRVIYLGRNLSFVQGLRIKFQN
jgi:hypothetical protein